MKNTCSTTLAVPKYAINDFLTFLTSEMMTIRTALEKHYYPNPSQTALSKPGNPVILINGK